MGVWPLVVPGDWSLIDHEGTRIPLKAGATSALSEFDSYGSHLLVGDNEGDALVVDRFWRTGPVTIAMADSYIADLRKEAEGELEVTSSALVSVKFSPEKAARVELRRPYSKKAAIDYLFRDELLRSWFVSYQFPESDIEKWTQSLAQLEK